MQFTTISEKQSQKWENKFTRVFSLLHLNHHSVLGSDGQSVTWIIQIVTLQDNVEHGPRRTTHAIRYTTLIYVANTEIMSKTWYVLAKRWRFFIRILAGPEMTATGALDHREYRNDPLSFQWHVWHFTAIVSLQRRRYHLQGSVKLFMKTNYSNLGDRRAVSIIQTEVN